MLRSALSSGEAAAETKGGKETGILHRTPFTAQHSRIILLQVARAAELELLKRPGNGILALFLKSEGVSFPFTQVVLSVTLRSSQFFIAVLK